MNTHVLLIDCPDEKGIIFKVTGVLFNNGLNILSNGEFVEKKVNHFFMRSEVSGSIDYDKVTNELHKVLPANANIKLTPKSKKKVLLLATKEHHCLGDLLIRHYYNELNAEVLAVISNYENLRDLAGKFNVPYHHVSHVGLSREEHEEEAMKVIDSYNPDFLVLAKYMRILTPAFMGSYKNRIVNIHHSFLPAFVGASPYAQAYERGVKIIGATAHFVTEDLDEGPIIAQNVMPVAHSQSAAEMAQAGRDIEKIVLAKSLKLVLEEKVIVYGNRTIIFD
ncbi:formyltetrahydrofolate deformylase [Cytophagaceae bacterium ABcell3]|nr:formyltetrahydrofolate deformylase [Cytophagaceae bacterium ABcell3]